MCVCVCLCVCVYQCMTCIVWHTIKLIRSCMPIDRNTSSNTITCSTYMLIKYYKFIIVKPVRSTQRIQQLFRYHKLINS